MQIILGVLFGACWGLAAHFALPGRDTRGPALGPVLGAVVGGAVWLALTWAGLTVENGWLWVASLVAPAVVCFVVIPILTRVRTAHDQRERERLGLG
ncbi:hypothetical protein LK09_05230 [Microbacterium mangrovi]|uniref:Integral membrane protein n=1 Tax=Microbacterium mangrovi TaxID=1348253 RepID=A0A0B2A9U0_9MICO|nr:hypothetical protein [Microbacterium mangrovi]KHK98406.1 hypothetical protein LK09_05230 [Microbacterium mangrovi]